MPLDVSRSDLSLAVIGTGTMGRGIAQVAAQAGIRVLLHDSRPGAAKEAKEAVTAQLARLAEKGRIDREAAARAGANLVLADSLAALAACPIVIEAVVENLGPSGSCSARSRPSSRKAACSPPTPPRFRSPRSPRRASGPSASPGFTSSIRFR